MRLPMKKTMDFLMKSRVFPTKCYGDFPFRLWNLPFYREIFPQQKPLGLAWPVPRVRRDAGTMRHDGGLEHGRAGRAGQGMVGQPRAGPCLGD